VFTISNLNSQELTKEERKVQIFTPDEKDNLQMWFHKEIHKMNFSEEELDDYYAVIFYYVSKISRLDDLDKNYAKEEFKYELNKLLDKQNHDLKELLNADRYELHIEIYAEFLRSAYKRWGVDN
jgi:hypothetical protein